MITITERNYDRESNNHDQSSHQSNVANSVVHMAFVRDRSDSTNQSKSGWIFHLRLSANRHQRLFLSSITDGYGEATLCLLMVPRTP